MNFSTSTVVEAKGQIDAELIYLPKGPVVARKLDWAIETQGTAFGKMTQLAFYTFSSFRPAASLLLKADNTLARGPIHKALASQPKWQASAGVPNSTARIYLVTDDVAHIIVGWMDQHCLSLGEE